MSQKIKILIVGNGFGGVYALKNLHTFFHNNETVEMSLIGEKNYFLFTPLLHEVATGGVSPENIIEPIRKILGCCLHDFYLGTVFMVNLTEKIVQIGDTNLAYDYLILAPGAQTNFYNIPGAEQHCLTLKSIEDALKIKNKIIGQIERSTHIDNRDERRKILKFIIVGGGPTGVELASEVQELISKSLSRYYKKEIIDDTSVVLIQANKELMPMFGAEMRKKSLEIMKRNRVEVALNAQVKEVDESKIILTDGTEIEAETVIWTAGIKPAQLNFDVPVVQSPDKRLIVNEFLQLQDHPEVFAIGDTALFTDKKSKAPLPALAQVAEKEAKSVAENISLLIKNRTPKEFEYHGSGTLVSLGHWMAIGEISNFTFWGHLTWWFWRTVYLSKLISLRKRIKVAIDWTINIFSPRDISQL